MEIMMAILLLTGVFGANSPEQIKLSWTGNLGEMMATWTTPQMGNSQLKFADSSSETWQVIEATQTEFKVASNRTVYKNTALMTNLKEEAYYKYVVGYDPEFSDQFIFKGITPGNSRNESATIIALADWGVCPNGTDTINALMKRNDFEGIFLFGDIAYDLQDNDGKQGDIFLNQLQPLIAKIPFMMIPGNHEDYNNFAQVKGRFTMPTNVYSEEFGMFYSFTLGPATIIMINTEFYLLESTKEIYRQLNFLIRALLDADNIEDERPWIILMSHHPLYCSYPNHNCSEQAEMLRHYLEDLIHYFDVDLVLSGHLHYYERDTAIYQNSTAFSLYEDKHKIINPTAPVYIVSGAAGNPEEMTDIPENKAEWTRFFNNDVGYGVIHLLNQTTLLWEQVNSKTDAVIDYLYIIKQSS